MDLVIKIDDHKYKEIKEDTEKFRSKGEYVPYLYEVIEAGTPLPKGHGPLKDADAICKDIIRALSIRNENYLLEAEKAVYKRIKNADTIIKADNTESEAEE